MAQTKTLRIDELDLETSKQLCVRIGTDEATVRNYAECFEQLPPITVFEADGSLVVVDGNHRTEAARRLGLETIEADVQKGTMEEANEAAALANVAHGKPLTTTEKRNAVDRLLLMDAERVNAWIADDIGVSQGTVDTRRVTLETNSQIETLTKLRKRNGDYVRRQIKKKLTGPTAPKVYTGKVHTMDVLEGLRMLDAGSADLCFTDPPYNIGVDYSNTTGADALPGEQYIEWCAKWFAEVRRVLTDTGSFYVMHYPEVCARWLPELSRLFTVRRWITWVYPSNVGQSPTNWTRASRTILFCTKGQGYTFNEHADPQPFRNPDDKRIKALIDGGQEGVTPYDWWEYDLVKNVSEDKTSWPNQIPVALAERIVKVSSDAEAVVLDPFMGSGTTAVAAAKNGRDWIGFDQEPRSAAVTLERIQALNEE